MSDERDDSVEWDERNELGQIVKKHLPPDVAKERGGEGGRKKTKDIQASARRLLEQHPTTADMKWDEIPEAAKILALQAAGMATGGLTALQAFLSSPEMAGFAKKKQAAHWNGREPCPTCGRAPNISLTVSDAIAVRLAERWLEWSAEGVRKMRDDLERGVPVEWDVANLGQGQARWLLEQFREAKRQSPELQARVDEFLAREEKKYEGQ